MHRIPRHIWFADLFITLVGLLLATDGRQIYFLTSDPPNFDGTLSEGDGSLAGTFRQGSGKFSFEMVEK